jgi:protein-L-isoaspartate(D-aspartate) O-methyltransferase
MGKKADYESARRSMVEDQLIPRQIRDDRVLAAMGSVPRHLFVPPDLRHLAYSDAPLPIGQRQTISQPYIVALMTELLELTGEERVLEVGTGSGYQAAVLAHVAKKVYSVERIPELADEARDRLKQMGVENVDVIHHDGSLGYPEEAPYDGIIVTAAAPQVPGPLKEQLADGGRLVLPVGGRNGQILERWRREGENFSREQVAPVAFVPLVGNQGWKSEEDGSPWWR